jgi:hypothetical protein
MTSRPPKRELIAGHFGFVDPRWYLDPVLYYLDVCVHTVYWGMKIIIIGGGGGGQSSEYRW